MFRNTLIASSSSSSSSLSPITVQLKVFSSVLALDACTGLPFPYHVQKMLDAQVNSHVNPTAAAAVPAAVPAADAAASTTSKKKGGKKASGKAAASKTNKKNKKKDDDDADGRPQGSAPVTTQLTHLTRLEPGKLKWWCSADWATEGKKFAPKTAEQAVVDLSSFFPATPGTTQNAAETKSLLLLSHISSFEPTGDAKGVIDAASADQKDAALLAAFRAKGGTPRDGLSGAFFTKQSVAYSLARSGLRQGFESPFWLPVTHPALHPSSSAKQQQQPFLELRPCSEPTAAAAPAVVYPAKRLALGEDAKKRVLSAAYLSSVGKAAASGINALSGASVPCKATLEFFKNHPEFAEDGWVSLDQVMKLGLPLHSSSAASSSSSKKKSAFDEIFDGGVFVDLFKQEYYSQDQLVRPGRLAMKKMPGVAEPLLNEVKPQH